MHNYHIFAAHTAIDIAKIDLRIRDNGKVHHTNRYELMEDEEALVLRRGIPFTINVSFSHESYIPKDDNMKLVFRSGAQISFISALLMLIFPNRRSS